MKKYFLGFVFALMMFLMLVPERAEASDTSNIKSLNVAYASSRYINRGDYILTSNLEITEPIEISDGSKVSIDLNGFVIEMTEDDREVITVTSGATLEIKDSNNPSKEHKFTVNDDGLYVLNEDATSNYKIIKGGVVTGGKASGIVAADKSKVIFSGGNIVGCKGNIGGIDFCGSELHMTGGNIIGCTGTYGGGIYA